MIIFLVAVILFLIFGKGSGTISFLNNPNVSATPVTSGTGTTPAIQTAVPVTSVIKNSTGGSLSGALGSSSNTPGYYASGNPGYSSGLGATKIVAGTSAPSQSSQIVRSGAAPTWMGGINRPSTALVPPTKALYPVVRGTVNVPTRTTMNPTASYNPTLANRPVVVSRSSPEVASAPWTKTTIAISGGPSSPLQGKISTR